MGTGAGGRPRDGPVCAGDAVAGGCRASDPGRGGHGATGRAGGCFDGRSPGDMAVEGAAHRAGRRDRECVVPQAVRAGRGAGRGRGPHGGWIVRALGHVLAWLVACGALATAGGALAPDLAVPQHYVEDRAGVIDAEYERRLNGLLQELEQKTGAQFIVLTVQTVQPLTIEQFSIALAEKWKLGQADKDNGLLLAVAVQDRQMRIETGYGLEGFLTDQFCGRVIREVMAPQFRQGRYGQGIYEAIQILTTKTAEQAGVTLTGLPKPVRLPSGGGGGVPCILRGLSALFPLLLFFLILTRGGAPGLLWFLLGASMG
ncbi:MAG TPA: TPM domain-containing protein, partial [Phycisphaerales bacterium]|nr:TPM domain-containing protein [Phycisphaerales bacterium]